MQLSLFALAAPVTTTSPAHGPCNRCGTTSTQRYDGEIECDHCGNVWNASTGWEFGIEIPADVANDNCVQDAAMRLREALKYGDGAKARADLQGWIDHARKNNRGLWVRGWCRWVRGYDRPSLPGLYRDGFDAAADDNDNGGGERPRLADAFDACPLP